MATVTHRAEAWAKERLARQPACPSDGPTEEEKLHYPGVMQMGLTFLWEWREWRKVGKPIVSPEVRQQRRELCLTCEKYDPAQDRCTKCGCYLHRIKVGGIIDADALAWSTKSCPLDPPRWTSLPPSAPSVQPNSQQEKGEGQG